jgi:putative ABC transport system ATP-binding protein
VRDFDLRVENVSVGFGAGRGRVQALNNVSIRFAADGLNLVTGHSGSGKTTLLSILGCLLKPDSGAVFLMGENVARLSENRLGQIRRRHLGYVFQAFRLFHALSALENVTLALRLSGVDNRQAKQTALEALAGVGLENKSRLLPNDLSGGEKQRVAIARALVGNPAVILADEPTASLDSGAAEQIAQMLCEMAATDERIVIVVSHDARWLDYSRRVVTMKDGRIVDERAISAAKGSQGG